MSEKTGYWNQPVTGYDTARLINRLSKAQLVECLRLNGVEVDETMTEDCLRNRLMVLARKGR